MELLRITQVGAKAIINSFLYEISPELAKGNRLEFCDLGVLEVVIWAARVAQKPKTLERVQVATKRELKFRMGRIMKQKLSETEAQV